MRSPDPRCSGDGTPRPDPARRAWHWLACHAACVAFGHERWIAPDGEWICMRCAHAVRREIPPFPAPPLREWSELPDRLDWIDD